MKLSETKCGAVYVVLRVDGDSRGTIRLRDMGFVPGTHVRRVSEAPSGDPAEYRLRGYSVIIRRELSELVEVSVL